VPCPPFGAARASRMESAAVVVARRGKNASARSCPLLALLAEAGAREPLPSSSRSQARSLVQDSGAPAWLHAAVRDSRRSQPKAAMGVQPGRSSHCLASQASYALGLSVSTLSAPADFAFSHACSSLTVQTMTMSPAFFSSLT
jgi:hypothetical protein